VCWRKLTCKYITTDRLHAGQTNVVTEKRQEVFDMGITWTQPSTLPVLCTPVSASTPAHPTKVGFLAVRGAALRSTRFQGADLDLHASLTNGGLLQAEQPRTNALTVRILPIMGAYGASVSAVQGSQKPETAAPAVGKASGVPPRGRPV
jgi:hypothetical protein